MINYVCLFFFVHLQFVTYGIFGLRHTGSDVIQKCVYIYFSVSRFICNYMVISFFIRSSDVTSVDDFCNERAHERSHQKSLEK